ncbi:MAG TPA: A/G-specific adenine glycosylase [Geminicoccus sp.]|uniref:A/G-specific adenine glycosylase n=1 Tax=Geminicoccus sp. TaxID=2024832 RepID=UPI002E33F89F|nr:A/G-specific adenine glycosylase [Geminicoccus sp.]HEX2524965.1 A/G-specific adenine glycosylase [Geminicoccus sp.]
MNTEAGAEEGPRPVASVIALLTWYDKARRKLPWRALPGEAADPWAVLVSEIMLQQTTVATVRSRFTPFLQRFPTPSALAAASMDEVLHAWQGLGYYRRARALKACAEAVVAIHGGVVPGDLPALLDLPGLGPYTARAVAAIAFNRMAVPVDANVARVLGRVIALELPPARAARTLQAAADTLADPIRPGDVAQALMELGALVCSPKVPSCLICPLQSDCRGFASGEPERYPGRPEVKERGARFAVMFLLEDPNGAFLFRQRPATGLLAGMIELPSTPWQAEPPDAPQVRDAAPIDAAWQEVPGEILHQFTHLDLSMRLMRARITASSPPGIWMPPEGFSTLALPTLTVRLLRHAGIWPEAGSKRSR